MFSLFESAGDGFSSHPRLICDTFFFLEKPVWMTRCHLILTQVYGVDISQSGLSNYTENYNAATHQAKKYHAEKGVNPNICLAHSIRDGQHKPSINNHYQVAQMKYAMQEMSSKNGIIIARDNKALVHTDVEVVQQPIRSWKVVQYQDHDWAKDPHRTLCFTTYQLVKETKMEKDAELICHLEKHKLRKDETGVSIIKVKTLAYAKVDSKRHSVEGYHVAENHALSQNGVLDSHMVHSSECTDGIFDLLKMKENMQYAGKDAAHRIHSVPYGGHKFSVYVVPSEDDWVISKEREQNMHEFLKKDNTEYRVDKNFIVHPKGPIWEAICSQYSFVTPQGILRLSHFQ